jgi:adenosylcobinamide-phosphate synthase
MGSAWVLILAMVLDAAFGEPNWIWSRLPHPAVVMGRIIGWADQRFNTGTLRKLKGTLTVIALVLGAGALGWVLSLHWLLELVVVAVLLAQRSLADHVGAVARGLRFGVDNGRRAVAMIVGRDTKPLNASGIVRSAIESAAENFGDGVIAPLFWYLVGGVPGILIYKVVNTADSMIGYRTPKHLQFGWAAARLDDVLNWVPARLTAVLIAVATGTASQWRRIAQDAPLHRSPNAGWPEAAMAVALNVAISGPRSYDGALRDFPYVNATGRHDLTATDITASVAVLWRSWAVMLAGVAGIAIYAAVF